MRRGAAATDGTAAPMEQAQPNLVFGRDGNQRLLGTVLGPAGGQRAGVLG